MTERQKHRGGTNQKPGDERVELSDDDLAGLIASTIDGIGEIDAGELPHRLRRELGNQVDGHNLEELIERALTRRK
ncbi:MAG: hypothetical protein AAGA22_03240 [Pseudomonadota bacterium]